MDWIGELGMIGSQSCFAEFLVNGLAQECFPKSYLSTIRSDNFFEKQNIITQPASLLSAIHYMNSIYLGILSEYAALTYSHLIAHL